MNATETALDTLTHQSLARLLHEAERTGVQVSQFSKQHPEMTLADSYAIQHAWMDIKRAEGRQPIGHKIGLTSRAMQVASQITEPDYGLLLDHMVLSDGTEVKTARFIVPRLEVELAFVLDQTLQGPGVTITDVLDATAYVVPALELIDARIEQFDAETKQPRKVFDTIADNAANGGIAMGGRPVRPDAIDLRWAGALLFKNGVIEESGLAAAVLNHPANGVAWLANRLGAHGESLASGEVVLCGSFTRPVACKAGDCFHADYGRLGSISLQFV